MASQLTMPRRSMISRSSTAPGSVVRRSGLASMRMDRLKVVSFFWCFRHDNQYLKRGTLSFFLYPRE